MTTAATRQRLELLHKLLADSFIERLEADAKDGIPTDAATLGAISKFLKDNEVTADPADSDELANLKRQFSELQSQRNNGRKTGAALAVVKAQAEIKTG